MHPAPRTGAVIDLERCDREDWMRTVAARLRTPAKAKARKGDPWGGEPDDAQATLERKAGEWIEAHCDESIRLCQNRDEMRAIANQAPADIAAAVAMILFARNPHLRDTPAESSPAPKAPALSVTVAPGRCPMCDGALTHSTEAGEKVLRCADEQGLRCDWAAVWREVAA